MHERLLHLFEDFKDFHHSVNMNDLFNSVNFTIAATTCKTKVRTKGVLFKLNCGAPSSMYQDKLSGKAAEKAQAYVKASVLMGDLWVNGLVVASVFDQKPFYMITNVAKEITWVEKSKKVWSDQLQKNLDMKFLCFCISHNYN